MQALGLRWTDKWFRCKIDRDDAQLIQELAESEERSLEEWIVWAAVLQARILNSMGEKQS